MGKFRDNQHGGGFSRGGSSRGGFGRGNGFSRGGSGGSRGRSFERREVEMHDAVCDKCHKNCQVPFRPTGDKPVLCSDCFREKDPRNNRGSGSGSGSGVSSEQIKQINTKLDKIISILEELEVIEGEEDLEDDDEDDDSEDEDLDEDDSDDEEEEK